MKKNILKMTLAFCICFTSTLSYADKVEKVSSETARKLSEDTVKTYQEFVEASVQLRLGYDYKNKFLTDQDRQSLHDMAIDTEKKLEQIHASQSRLLELIEDYEGDDWEKKFGKTGLWKRLKKNIFSTIVFQSEVSFYKNLCVDSQLQVDNSKISLEKLELYGQSDNFYVKLIKAKFNSLFDPAKAIEIMNEINREILIGEQACIYDVEINKIRIDAGLVVDVNAVRNAVQTCGEFETGIKGAFLLGRLGDMSALQQIIEKYSQSEFFVSRLSYHYIADLIESNEPLDKVTLFEAELAAKYAIAEQDIKKNEDVMTALIGKNRFQNPAVYYAAAKVLEDNKHTVKAVDFYIVTSLFDGENPYKIDAATRAIELGYRLYTHNPENTALAIKAFENYKKCCGDDISPQQQYLYGKVVAGVGMTEKAKKIFTSLKEQISEFTNFARYELLYIDILSGTPDDPNKRDTVISELLGLIKAAKKQKQTQLEKNCLLIYGQMLVGQGNDEQAKEFLEKAKDIEGGELNIYKGWAYGKLKDYQKAVDVFYKSFKQEDIDCASQAIWLIGQIADRIEYILEGIKNKNDFIDKCIYIGRQSWKNCKDMEKAYAGMYLIELLGFSEKYDPVLDNVLDEIAQKIDTNSIEFLRAKARFSYAKADFRTAGMCWSRINSFYRTDQTGEQDSRWWRSKYYELLSLSKLPGSKDQILHTIEVTKNSHPTQDDFWNAKLDILIDHINSK